MTNLQVQPCVQKCLWKYVGSYKNRCVLDVSNSNTLLVFRRNRKIMYYCDRCCVLILEERKNGLDVSNMYFVDRHCCSHILCVCL